MKRKIGQDIEQNIILSDDITIEAGSNRGKSLREVLEKQDADIEKLKSNVKWIYKYGGVGSGKGGGVSTSWSIYAKLGGEVISGAPIILPKKGQYVLNIQINNPSGGTFRVTYEYSNSKKTITLTQDNIWRLEETITLNDNNRIRIEVLDENAEMKTLESDYITSTHTIGFSLVEDNGKEFSSSDNVAFLSRIKTNGLNVKVTYSVINSINSFTIKYTPFGSLDTHTETIDTSEAHSGWKLLPAFEKPCSEITPESGLIGTFSYKLEVIIDERSTKYEQPLTILPGTLYLLVRPIEGKIYTEDEVAGIDEENAYKYYKGTISFDIIAYKNMTSSGDSMNYYTFVKKPGSEEWESRVNGRISERVTTRVVLGFSTVGWNAVKFRVEGAGTFEKTIYLYIKDFESQLNWYPKFLQSRGTKYFFRTGQSDSSNSGFYIVNDNGQTPLTDTISMSINSAPVHLIPDPNILLPQESNDCLICIGIQYNSTSNDSKIVEISSNGNDQTMLTVYQNSVYYASNKIGDIYLGTELDDYNINNGKNYHLITIYRRLVSEGKYELCVYLDGILETVRGSYVSAAPIYTDIEFFGNNYYINTLEISYFPHNNNRDYLTDTGIVHYWYTYREQLRYEAPDPKITKMLDTFEQYNDTDVTGETLEGVYLEGTHVAIGSKDTLDKIVRYSTVPVMLFTREDTAGDNFFVWSEDTSLLDNTDDDEKNPIKVGVQWSPGSTTDEDAPGLSPIDCLIGENRAEFYIEIQGSSTKRFHSKNYTLSLKWVDDQVTSYVPLFSPNFDPTDTSTFLPEQEFTLKADVIDSGHSNNTCMGSFINKVTQKFSNATENTDRYKDFVRNCLEGFPFLLFVGLTTEEDGTKTTKYYYLGIYNFNLGRSSYFNLGYCSTSGLPEPNSEGKYNYYYNNNFCYCRVVSSSYMPKTDFISAEIAYNNNFFDFSQYHKSILFKKDDGDDTFMFGDLYAGNTGAIAKDHIALFVKATARAGGFIFKELEKDFDEEHESGYSIPNCVPGHLIQYRKEIAAGAKFIRDDELTSEMSGNKPNLNDLLNYVGIGDDPTLSNYTVDYQSLVEYYLICMTFGLIDSVQKNLTIKSWGGRKFYLAFYDMDTSLGINNNGDPSTYYAFSDFWKETEGLSNVEGSEGVLAINEQVEVLRDHFNKSFYPGVIGFDVPSNYAFAVAKYFHSVTQNGYSNRLISPQTMWARWRSSVNTSDGYGYLSNADKFIDEFYLGYMKEVNELMFNFNYRQKYLRHEENSFDLDDMERFHGRRVEFIRDWLSGRLHIMDAYLNIGSANVKLKPSEDFRYYEQRPMGDVDKSNPDIFVIRDIFSSGKNQINGDLRFTVQAPDFSPLLITRGNVVSRYLLADSNYKYEVNAGNAGTNAVTIGGSALWTYLDSINSFIQNKMEISSNRLKNISGTTGTVGEWSLTLPALQTITLTSANYSGDLEFDASLGDKFPNLRTIDISNSGISLKVRNENIETVTAIGVGLSSSTAPSFEITECRKLSNVQVRGSRFSKFIVDPVWEKNIVLKGNRMKYIDLGCREDNPSTLTLSDEAVTSLRITNFSEVTIEDCPLLEEIVINGNNLTKFTISNELSAPNLVKLSISNVSKMTSLSLGGCINFSNLTLSGDTSLIETLNLSKTKVKKIVYDSGNIESLDLRPMSSLKTLNINHNTAVTYIYLNNKPGKGIAVNVSDCSSLYRIYGHIKVTDTGALSHLSSNFKLLGNYWHGVSTDVVTNNNKTPLQIMAGVDIVNPEDQTGNNIKTPSELHNEICNKFNTVLNRETLTEAEQGGIPWFSEGDNQTNLTFGNTEGNVKNSRSIGPRLLDGICAGSPISEFEIYYVLCAFAVSAARCNSGKVSSQSLNTSFWYSSNTKRFDYESRKYPNRYMFYGCSKITSFGSYTFSTSGSNYVKLLAPSHNEDGEVLCDNGLFSPLVDLTYVGEFVPTNICASRFLFRRLSGKYKIRAFWKFFYSGILCDEVDTKDWNYINGIINSTGDSRLAKVGDFTGFFDDIEPDLDLNPNNLENYHIYESFSPTYINFNTLVLPNKIPLYTVTYSFNSKYGYGTINLRNIFQIKDYLTGIVNSFKVSNINTNYQEILNNASGNSIDSGGRALFPIYNGMFSGFVNLKYIGASDTMPNSNSESEKNGRTVIGKDESILGGRHTITGFTGNGLLKYIDGTTFPYNIFQENGLKDNLEICAGFMSELTTYGSSNFGNNGTDKIRFPGNLFLNLPNLKNVAAFLKNCKIPYELTSNGFSGCTKLENITEIFYSDTGSNSDCSRLEGSIPARLFYHGSNSTTASFDVYGTDVDTDGLSVGDYYGNDAHKVTISYNTISYNKNIKYACGAFWGCALIGPYTKNLDENFGKIDNTKEHVQINVNNNNSKTVDITNISPEYTNPSYTYWKHVARSSTGSFVDGDTRPLDISLVYDGESSHINSSIKEKTRCEEDFTEIAVVGEGTSIIAFQSLKNFNTTQFCCPPDLFLYFKDDSDTNIQYTFCNCGISPTTLNLKVMMKGRICPYLLKPLSKITSLAGMFRWCSGLSSVKYLPSGYNNEDLAGAATYLIPPTFFSYATKVTLLPGTFAGVYFESSPSLNVFNYLPLSLDIRGIFAWCGYVAGSVVGGVFAGNSLSSISGAFSAKPIYLTEFNSSYPGGVQGIATSHSMRQGVTLSNNFPSAISARYTYYVYYRTANQVTDTITDTIISNIGKEEIYHNFTGPW